MTAARYVGAAALLPNGKVLICCGVDFPSGPVSSTEIYDPSANSFSAGPTPSASVAPTAALLLPNGKVLLTGEVTNGNVTMAELYNPADNSMAERSLNTFRQYPTSALLPNGKVLIAGGCGNVNGQV